MGKIESYKDSNCQSNPEANIYKNKKFIKDEFDSLIDNFDKIHPNVSAYKNNYSWNCRKKIVIRNSIKSGTILDIGCGTGGLLNNINNDSRLLVGIDLSSKALKLCDDKILTIQGDTMNLPFNDNVFSQVLFIEVIQYIDDIEKIFNEINRVLKPDGIMIFCFQNYYFYHYQKIIKKNIDLSSKKRTFIIHKNEDIYMALANTGFKIVKTNKMPNNFTPMSLCFAIGVVCQKQD